MESVVRPGRSQTGHALVQALLVLLLVSLALALVAQSLNLALGDVRHEMRAIRLAALADAAVAEAVAHLVAQPDFPGLAEHPFGGGTLASEVQRMGALSWRVEATARAGGLSREVRVRVIGVTDAEGNVDYRISGWSAASPTR